MREKQSEMYSHLKPIHVPKTTTQKRKVYPHPQIHNYINNYNYSHIVVIRE